MEWRMYYQKALQWANFLSMSFIEPLPLPYQINKLLMLNASLLQLKSSSYQSKSLVIYLVFKSLYYFRLVVKLCTNNLSHSFTISPNLPLHAYTINYSKLLFFLLLFLLELFLLVYRNMIFKNNFIRVILCSTWAWMKKSIKKVVKVRSHLKNFFSFTKCLQYLHLWSMLILCMLCRWFECW